MSRFSNTLSNLFSFSTISRHQVALDLGSYYLRVVVDDQLIINQPNCFLFDPASQTVVATGNKAFHLFGKEPGHTQVIFPFKEGVVTDLKPTRLYLEAILAQVKDKTKLSLLTALMTACAVSSLATALDKKVLKKVLQQAGWGQVELVTASRALWQALSYQLKHDHQALTTKNSKQHTQLTHDKRSQVGVEHAVKARFDFKVDGVDKDEVARDLVVIDLGHYLTEVGIMSQERANYSHTLNFGGHNLTEAIRQVLKQKFQIQVSYQQAEELKRQLPDLINDQTQTAKTNIRGVDTSQHLITTKTISTQELAVGVRAHIDKLFHYLQRTFSQVEPERLLAAFDNGVYVTGGASRLAGIDNFLSRQLEVNIITADNPYLDMVKGLALINRT